MVVFPLCLWCPPLDTSQPHPPTPVCIRTYLCLNQIPHDNPNSLTYGKENEAVSYTNSTSSAMKTSLHTPCCNVPKYPWWGSHPLEEIQQNYSNFAHILKFTFLKHLNKISLNFVCEIPTNNKLALVWQGLGTHFTKGPINSKFCTCHDGLAAVTWAKLWPNRILIIKCRTMRLFPLFELWAHCEMVHGATSLGLAGVPLAMPNMNRHLMPEPTFVTHNTQYNPYTSANLSKFLLAFYPTKAELFCRSSPCWDC